MPFKKGQSGNPSGRPKEDPEVKALARKYSKEAIECLRKWMRSNDRAAIRAAQAILDRAWGRPAQEVEVSGKSGAPIVLSFPVRDE